MQQRVNPGRVSLSIPDPALDEPFAALDAQTGEAMQSELLSPAQGPRRSRS
jgi:ABC-type nitrate/sulfonate/bicarbonate transport system ATPase subunit